MKQINTYINEKLRLTSKHTYSCQPTSKKELQQIIMQRMEDEGHQCDLNDIDVSKINDMSNLFDTDYSKIFKNFNGDISMWDVSNVKIMEGMFDGCEKFNCDVSKWDVSKVKNMNYMFSECKKFNQDLNSWNVSNVKNMRLTFYECPTKPIWYDKDKWED